MSTYYKEAAKTSYDELAGSLQLRIANLTDVNQYRNTKSLVNTIRGRVGDITITAGQTEPVSGVYPGADGHPITVKNDLAIHLNSKDKVLEFYHNNTWNKHRLVYL